VRATITRLTTAVPITFGRAVRCGGAAAWKNVRCGGAAAWKNASNRRPPVGFPDDGGLNLDLLREGLADVGYVEGRHYMIEARWAEGQLDRLPGLAAELVRAGVDVIVTSGPPAIRAARETTTTILSAKWLELLRAAVPRLNRVAILWDSTGTKQQVTTVEAVARTMDVQTHVLEVRRPADYEGHSRRPGKPRPAGS
jgi:hypothetical protein